jgi:hypothetical protein
MSNDIKSGIGYIIPFGAIIGFFTALFLGEFLISIIIAIAGILVWFLYMVVMESSPPSNLGNLIIFFGILLSIGIFMGFGVSQNMWGGIEFVSEGSLFALVILFFSILTGMLFRGQPFIQQPATSYDLSAQEKKWVDEALKNNGQDTGSSDPKVIVVRQESNSDDKTVSNSKGEDVKPEAPQYNNPYVYAYPPEYYYDEDEEDGDGYEDDYEDDYEE